MADLKSSIAITGKDLKIGKSLVSSPQTLDKLIQSNYTKIIEIKNIFPFDFFPDRVIVSTAKIDLVYGIFFFSEYVTSMLMKDIKAVKLSTGIFFATLEFEYQGHKEFLPKIKWLPIAKAIKVRRIVEGLMASDNKNVDLSQYTAEELETKLEEIGRARVG